MLSLHSLSKALCFFLFFSVACSDTSEDARVWNELLKAPSQQALEQFLDEYPESSYRPQALKKKEEYQWQAALLEKTLFPYIKYLNDYPDGKYREEAQAFIDAIESPNFQIEKLYQGSFVGHIDYGAKQIQVLSMKFRAQTPEEEPENSDPYKQAFIATVNTKDFRKDIRGVLQLPEGLLLFEEEADEQSEVLLGLSKGRVYYINSKLFLESTDPQQYWALR